VSEDVFGLIEVIVEIVEGCFDFLKGVVVICIRVSVRL